MLYEIPVCTLTATGLEGATEKSNTIQVSSIFIEILSTANDIVINRKDVIVHGTVTNLENVETAVTVNRVIASVSGNQFAANHVFLTEGENTITATVSMVMLN